MGAGVAMLGFPGGAEVLGGVTDGAGAETVVNGVEGAQAGLTIG